MQSLNQLSDVRDKMIRQCIDKHSVGFAWDVPHHYTTWQYLQCMRRVNGCNQNSNIQQLSLPTLAVYAKSTRKLQPMQLAVHYLQFLLQVPIVAYPAAKIVEQLLHKQVSSITSRLTTHSVELFHQHHN